MELDAEEEVDVAALGLGNVYAYSNFEPGMVRPNRGARTSSKVQETMPEIGVIEKSEYKREQDEHRKAMRAQ